MTHVAGCEEHGLEEKQRDATAGGLVGVSPGMADPEVALVDERQKGVDVAKVLREELPESAPGGNAET